MHATATRQSARRRTNTVNRTVRVEDVDAATGVVLRFAVWGVDFDGVVDSGGGDCWFVGVAYYHQSTLILDGY